MLFATWMSMGLSICVVVTAVSRTDYRSDEWPQSSCLVLRVADFSQDQNCAKDQGGKGDCKHWDKFNTTHTVWVNSSGFSGQRKANLCGTTVSNCEDCHESDELNDVLHSIVDCWYDPTGGTWGAYATSVKLLYNCDRIPDAILWAIAAVQMMGSFTLGGMAVVALWGLSHSEVVSLTEDRLLPGRQIIELEEPGDFLRWFTKIKVGCTIWIDVFGLIWFGCSLLTVLVTLVVHHQNND